jgi:ERCC4-type nuclease
MQNNFKNCYLIISGDPKTVFMNPYIKNWTTNHHLGAMISLLVHFNLKIQQTENSSQLINAVSKIIKKSQDGKSPSIFDTELMMIKASDLDIKTKMLMCLPLIGKEKGQKLSEKLDIRIIRKDTGMLIDEKNFPWIEGIGDKTIEEIVKINRKDTPIPAPLIVNKGATPDPPKN